MRNLFTFLFLLLFATTSAAQLQHASKVQIKPTTPQVDALRVWGGIQAGLGGNVQVVDINGNLVISGTISGGSEGAPGVAPTTDPDTGWYWPAPNELAASLGGVERVRFDSIGRVGLNTDTPATRLHVVEPSSQVSLRLERTDQEAWDISVNTNLTVTHVGGLTPLTLTPTTIGIFNNTPSASYALDITGGVNLTGNLSVGSFIASALVPSANDLYSIGSTTRSWKEAFITQINSVIFAENTVQITGGWQIVGKNAGSFATDVASGATTMDLGKTIGAVPQWILIKSYDASGALKTEYVSVDTLASGTTYNVTRDLTSLHATDPAWNEGTPWLLLGQEGDGRVQLYASSGLAQISILRQGATASAQTDLVRLGGLDGMPTMGASPGRYGIFIGEGSTSYLKYQKQPSGAASGDDEKLIVQGTIQATAGWFGDSTNDVTVDSTGLNVGNTGAVRGGATSYASGTGFWFGFDSGEYRGRIGTTAGNRLTWASGTLTIAGDGGGVTNINGGNIQTGTVTATQINVSQLSAISADLGTITAGTVTGATLQTASSGARVVIDSSNGLRGFDSGSTLQVQISNSTGALTAGAGAVTLDDTGIFVTPVVNTGFVGASSYRFIDATSSREPGLYYSSADTLERQMAMHFTSSPTASGLHVASFNTGGVVLSLSESASTSEVFTSAAQVQIGSVFHIFNSNSTSTPGTPWIRGNGNDLVINPDAASTLYLAWDAGSAVYVGTPFYGGVASDSVDLGGSSHRWKDIYFSEPTTSAVGLFPLVTSSGRIMAKNNGFNGTVTCGAGEAIKSITAEFGVIVGTPTCGAP